jgi:hypothetical protein
VLIAAFCILAVSATVSVLLLRSAPVRPYLSRSDAINVALEGYQRPSFSRIEAKLVRFDDLRRANPSLGLTQPGSALTWVVAVSGNYGVSPSFGCCSVPAGYHGKNTWGLAVVPDLAGQAKVYVVDDSWHGNWPPYFESLPDLAD